VEITIFPGRATERELVVAIPCVRNTNYDNQKIRGVGT
jgi:hypothetical protein